MSGSAPQTSSAASYVHPPAKTERDRNRRRSSGSRRWYDHSMVVRRVCWRGSALRPPLSRSSRCDGRLEQLLRCEDDGSSRGELEREWKIVEPRAELGDHAVRGEIGRERSSARVEKGDAVVVFEGGHRVDLLARDLQSLSARHDEHRACTELENSNLRCRRRAGDARRYPRAPAHASQRASAGGTPRAA